MARRKGRVQADGEGVGVVGGLFRWCRGMVGSRGGGVGAYDDLRRAGLFNP